MSCLVGDVVLLIWRSVVGVPGVIRPNYVSFNATSTARCDTWRRRPCVKGREPLLVPDMRNTNILIKKSSVYKRLKDLRDFNKSPVINVSWNKILILLIIFIYFNSKCSTQTLFLNKNWQWTLVDSSFFSPELQKQHKTELCEKKCFIRINRRKNLEINLASTFILLKLLFCLWWWWCASSVLIPPASKCFIPNAKSLTQYRPLYESRRYVCRPTAERKSRNAVEGVWMCFLGGH